MRQRRQDQQSENVAKLRKADQLTQYFENMSQQKKTLQLFDLMVQQSKVVYVDKQKQYVIVKTSYLQSLQQQLHKSQENIDRTILDIKNEQLSKTAMNKFIQFKQKEQSLLKQMNKKLEAKLIQLEGIIKTQDNILNQKQNEIQNIVSKYQRRISHAQSNVDRQKFNPNQKRRQQNYSQTEFESQSIPQLKNKMSSQKQCRESAQNKGKEYLNEKDLLIQKILNKNMFEINKEQILQQKYEKQLQTLKNNFSKALQEMSMKCEKKLLQLQQQKIQVQKWRQENQKIRQQNRQLELKIRQVNQQQQKIKIWKSSLKKFIQNVQSQHKNIIEPNLRDLILSGAKLFLDSGEMQNEGGRQNMKYVNEERIKVLQSTIDRLQLEQRQRVAKMSQIKQMIDAADNGMSVSEENIVGNLLNLSIKIKEVVRFLLEEI